MLNQFKKAQGETNDRLDRIAALLEQLVHGSTGHPPPRQLLGRRHRRPESGLSRHPVSAADSTGRRNSLG
jgi:hypothetical protein